MLIKAERNGLRTQKLEFKFSKPSISNRRSELSHQQGNISKVKEDNSSKVPDGGNFLHRSVRLNQVDCCSDGIHHEVTPLLGFKIKAK